MKNHIICMLESMSNLVNPHNLYSSHSTRMNASDKIIFIRRCLFSGQMIFCCQSKAELRHARSANEMKKKNVYILQRSGSICI